MTLTLLPLAYCTQYNIGLVSLDKKLVLFDAGAKQETCPKNVHNAVPRMLSAISRLLSAGDIEAWYINAKCINSAPSNMFGNNVLRCCLLYISMTAPSTFQHSTVADESSELRIRLTSTMAFVAYLLQYHEFVLP